MPNQTFKIQGMHCESCKKIIERRISKIQGVISGQVDLTTEILTLEAESEIKAAEIQEVLKDTEYKVT